MKDVINIFNYGKPVARSIRGNDVSWAAQETAISRDWFRQPDDTSVSSCFHSVVSIETYSIVNFISITLLYMGL